MRKDANVRYLTVDQAIFIHDALVYLEGDDAPLLSVANLEMAVFAPGRTVYGVEVHCSMIEKAASYMFELTTLHPFVDGNKRTALISGATFLEMNGCSLDIDLDDGLAMMMRLAQGFMGIEELVQILDSAAHQNDDERG